MPLRFGSDQRLHDLLHERPNILASIREQTFSKAPSGPKLRFGHHVLHGGGLERDQPTGLDGHLLIQVANPGLTDAFIHNPTNIDLYFEVIVFYL